MSLGCSRAPAAGPGPRRWEREVGPGSAKQRFALHRARDARVKRKSAWRSIRIELKGDGVVDQRIMAVAGNALDDRGTAVDAHQVQIDLVLTSPPSPRSSGFRENAGSRLSRRHCARSEATLAMTRWPFEPLATHARHAHRPRAASRLLQR